MVKISYNLAFNQEEALDVAPALSHGNKNKAVRQLSHLKKIAPTCWKWAQVYKVTKQVERVK